MTHLKTLIAACLMPAVLWAADPNPATDHAALRDRVLNVLDTQFDGFRTASAHLAQVAEAHCANTASKDDLKAAFGEAWIAWAPLDAYQFGPMEHQGAALKINFYPDKKNFVGRAVAALLDTSPADQADPQKVAAQSAGTQGLPALELLIYTDLPTCPAIIGVAGNVARLADDLYDGWFAPEGWADLVRAAGPDNPVYLTDEEFTRQIYTALNYSILRLREHRIGRPLGTFERSFPTRAEAWRSGLTNQIIAAQLNGIPAIVDGGFAGAVFNPSRAWIRQVVADTQDRLSAIGMPIAQAVEDPQTRFRVEALQTKLDYLQLQLDQDIGPGLGVETGFSAGDGD